MSSLPPLEDLLRMESHPELGVIEEFEEMTAQEFFRMVRAIPRKEWQWHNREAERLEGVFSVPLKYKMEGNVQHRAEGGQRLFWRVSHYTEDGQKWLRLLRQPAPPKQESLL